MRRTWTIAAALTAVVVLAGACGSDGGTDGAADGGSLTVYSGRSEDLIGALIERFEQDSGIDVSVRYGDTAELAAQILEEGDGSPADVFFAQDAGALGALQEAGRFTTLDQATLDRVPAGFRSREGRWVGASGRVRVIAFNPTLVEEADVPDTIDGLTGRAWRGKVGWAPTNGSFQIFVTALRVLRGEDGAKEWLEDMKANRAKQYPNNDSIAEAIADEEIPLGLVNHYYPFEIRAENPGANVRDHFLSDGDPGGLVNVAGVGILNGADNADEAKRFVDFLLSEDAQRYFVEQTHEYPLVEGVEPNPELPELSELEPPDVDLSQLDDLEGTLDLLREVELL